MGACGPASEPSAAAPSGGTDAPEPPFRYEVLTTAGGRVDWSPEGERIAYDRLEDDRFYDVRLMDADGNDLGCLTCDHPDLPNRDIGQPAWHPDGKYLVFQAEKLNHDRVRLRNVTAPGAGKYNDLWIMEVATREVFLLHEIPNEATAAVLHPHFSHDGTRLSWGQQYGEGSLLRRGTEIGLWKLCTADFFVSAGAPRLENKHCFVPGAEGWYENHGFSKDGSRLLFAGPYETGVPVYLSNIYLFDPLTQEAVQLTDEGYNEHASLSPDGEWLVWMTNADVAKHESGARGTEFWRMRPDGTAKERLTFFNEEKYAPRDDTTFVAADSSWAPDGKRFVGYMHVVSGPVEIVSATAGEFWNVLVYVEP